MHQNLQKWCFPSKNIHAKIFEKYKDQVGFPKDFIWKLERHKDPTVAVSLGARAYRTSKRVQERGIHKFTSKTAPLLDGDIARAITAQDLTKLGLHIDYAHAISLGYAKEKYYLILVVDGIDFVWGQTCTTRSSPEDLIQEFLTMTNLKVSSVRFDGAQEFGKSHSFKAYCHNEKIVMEPVAHYTHIQNARAENAIRVAKEHVRCLLRASNLPKIFWSFALLHFLRMRAYWPSDPHNRSAWERLDAISPDHKMRHDITKDLHVFGSYVTGHLPRTHPLVDDTTHDDRALEGIWLGNELHTPNFKIWSFKHKKVYTLSDPRHFDTILPFLQPGDVGHKIDLTVEDIQNMHAADNRHNSPTTLPMQTRSQRLISQPTTSGEIASNLTPSSDSGENIRRLDQGEQDIRQNLESSNMTDRIANMVDDLLKANDLTLKEHKAFKRAEEVPPEAVIQYLQSALLGRVLVYHKHVLSLPCSFLQIDNTVTEDLKLMASRAYAIKGFPYIDYEVIAPTQMQLEYKGTPIQIPVAKGSAKSTNHKGNVIDVLRQTYNKPVSLADIGINAARNTKIHSAITELSPNISEKDERRKKLEAQVAELRASEYASKAISVVKERRDAELKAQKEMTQVTDTFPQNSSSIWDEIDLLEGSPAHRGAAMRNLKFKPFWLTAEETEWSGLWEKGVFKKWNRKDLLSNDRVFTSRYVYKIKRNAKTGAAYRFKARLIVRGFEMEKHVDYDDNFSPTPGIALARIMVSLAAANDLELHSVDIEQAFTQADKLPEGVNGRYFINPPPGSPDAGNKDIVYEVLRPLYGNPSSPRALHKTMDAYFKSEGFDTVGFEESVWRRPAGGKYADDIFVSAHVDDCLIACKSAMVMASFKQDLLSRFVGTDEGEVTEYLGCEIIRDREAKTAKIVQAGYAERVLKTFGLWDCHPVNTPLDANNRLSKRDCPEVVDPNVHRRYRSIVGCLSYLVNMTRPDLAFSYSQLSKFVQYPGKVHMEAAERVLQYVRATYDQGIAFYDLGADKRNKLGGWVDSDFASDADSRKSMTGYLMSLNGGPISWKSSRQGGVTLSSSEAEFVAASQAGQEVVYLRALLKGLGYSQKGPTEIWEDNASCIMMSENPTNRDRSRHVDVKVHFLRDLVRDGHVKLIKCAGTQNVSDALTKSLPRPAFEKHREFMVGTRVPFSAFYAGVINAAEPVKAYVIKLPVPMYSKKRLVSFCAGG